MIETYGEKSNHLESIPNREVGPHQAADPGRTDACLCREIAAVFMRVAPLTVILIYIAAAPPPPLLKPKAEQEEGEGEGSGSPSLSGWTIPHRIPGLLSIALLVSTSLKQDVSTNKISPLKSPLYKSFCDEIDIDASFIEVSNN